MKKTIFITGSSSGLGKATAIYFAESGWNVVATMRNTEKGKFLSDYPNCLVIELDVQNLEQTHEAAKKGYDHFGSIDVLFNCAGYGGVFFFEDKNDEYFRRQFGTNFYGTVNTSRAVIPYMRKQRSGHIINTTSIAGKVGIPFQTAYVSSKHAVSGFTNTLAFELKNFGISATVFEVGAMNTNFVSAMDNAENIGIADYKNYFKEVSDKLDKALHNTYKNAPTAKDVAPRVMKLVNMKNPPVFFRPTGDSRMMEVLRRILPFKRFRSLASFGLE